PQEGRGGAGPPLSTCSVPTRNPSNPSQDFVTTILGRSRARCNRSSVQVEQECRPPGHGPLIRPASHLPALAGFTAVNASHALSRPPPALSQKSASNRLVPVVVR